MRVILRLRCSLPNERKAPVLHLIIFIFIQIDTHRCRDNCQTGRHLSSIVLAASFTPVSMVSFSFRNDARRHWEIFIGGPGHPSPALRDASSFHFTRRRTKARISAIVIRERNVFTSRSRPRFRISDATRYSDAISSFRDALCRRVRKVDSIPTADSWRAWTGPAGEFCLYAFDVLATRFPTRISHGFRARIGVTTDLRRRWQSDGRRPTANFTLLVVRGDDRVVYSLNERDFSACVDHSAFSTSRTCSRNASSKQKHSTRQLDSTEFEGKIRDDGTCDLPTYWRGRGLILRRSTRTLIGPRSHTIFLRVLEQGRVPW